MNDSELFVVSPYDGTLKQPMLIYPKEQEAIHSTIHRLEQKWNIFPMPDDKQFHMYDRLPFWQFLCGLREIVKLTSGRRILDIGCGIGTNLSIAHSLGFQVSGIDKNKQYIEAARELLPEGNFIVSDAFDIKYFDADIIYMYRPAKSDKLENELEEHVKKNSPDGVVMFWPFRKDIWVK